ncbi:MAG: protein translocase subunit SecD [Hyphomicrobiales bacterium]|nr:protein translocase subunit SecD [Hyphomicrobiales bacterium]
MVRFANWKAVVVVLLCLVGAGFAAPNLLSQQFADSLPDWLPHRQISLGLDLQGGSHLLLEVETDSVVSEQLESIVDAARDVLREERIRYSGLKVQGHAAVVSILDADVVERARKLLSDVDPATSIDAGEGGRLTITLSERALTERRASAVQQSIEIIRRRIDETGVREPTIQRQGADRILVQLPGVGDPERIKALIGKTAKMTFHLVDDRDGGFAGLRGERAPPGTVLLPMADAQKSAQGGPQKLLVRKRVVVSGENLVDAQPTFQEGRPVVSFRFDTVGGKRFGDVTSHNVGRLLAIVLDGEIISAPRIQTAILGGSGVITGSFSVSEARDLALLLRAGALPAPLKILEERTVGPGLGSDSIAAGKLASVVGLALVAVFMVAAYGLFGIFAVIALFINLVLIFAALSALQATLTLPGIAGIALTIGMAVDANVLIFEHIREEVAAGRTPISAVDAGFTRALTTIVDSNLTTLFAAVLLYIFGSGPVRGFGVTLSIGIVTSMFTAMMVTRLMVVTWLSRTRPTLIPI